MIVPEFSEPALVHAARQRVAALPMVAATRVLTWVVDIADALAPDDRSVLVRMVAHGDLRGVFASARFASDPTEVRRQLDRTWRAALAREQLPYVPLPAIRLGPWP